MFKYVCIYIYISFVFLPLDKTGRRSPTSKWFPTAKRPGKFITFHPPSSDIRSHLA